VHALGGPIMTPFQTLLSHLSSLEPRGGWSSTSQVRPLTDAEISICLDQNPDLVRDMGKLMFRLVSFRVATILKMEWSPAERALEVGLIFRNRLECMCRSWLLEEMRHESAMKESENAGS
jgi:hypothetical protein